MAELHLLGTGAALSDGTRTTTMIAVESERSALLVDCGGDAIHRLQAAGVPPAKLDALFLTHRHPDHVAGFPLLMEKLWLSDRSEPLPVYGPESALQQVQRCFSTFDTTGWTDLFELEWHPIPLEERHVALENDTWRCRTSPGLHGDLDVVGIRFERDDRACTYSADTEPSEAIARLAAGSELLVHEATDQPNHSSPEAAGRIAAEAEAGRLVLVHLPPESNPSDLDRVRPKFDGPIYLGRDGDSFRW